MSTQTISVKARSDHSSCCHRSKPIYDSLSLATTSTQSRPSTIDDPLQQQISIQNMFDAIKVKFKSIAQLCVSYVIGILF